MAFNRKGGKSSSGSSFAMRTPAFIKLLRLPLLVCARYPCLRTFSSDKGSTGTRGASADAEGGEVMTENVRFQLKAFTGVNRCNNGNNDDV